MQRIRSAVISVVFGIGLAYYFLGNYTEARINLQRALADAESIKEVKVAALCNDYLGQTFGAMNNQAMLYAISRLRLNYTRRLPARWK